MHQNYADYLKYQREWYRKKHGSTPRRDTTSERDIFNQCILSGFTSMSVLSKRLKVSRKTCYNWLHDFKRRRVEMRHL